MALLHPLTRESPELAFWGVVSLVCSWQEPGAQAAGHGCGLVYQTHCPAGAPCPPSSKTAACPVVCAEHRDSSCLATSVVCGDGGGEREGSGVRPVE